MLSKNLCSFLRPLKNKGFREESMTKVGLYAIDKSTTLESNKSLSNTLGSLSGSVASFIWDAFGV